MENFDKIASFSPEEKSLDALGAEKLQFETREGLNLSAPQPGRTAACARIM